MTCHPNRNRGVAPSRRAAPKRDRRRWRRLAIITGPELVLSALPSYPRPVLERMASRIIDRLDEIDGDADSEDSHDREHQDEREPCPIEGDGPPRFFGT